MERAIRVPCCLAVAFVALLAGCSPEQSPPTSPAPDAAAARLLRVREVRQRLSGYLDSIEGVEGHAVEIGGDGVPRIRLYTSRSRVAVPAEVAGAEIDAEQTGEFFPFALTDRLRPVPMGASVGNDAECLPGTVGAFVEKRDGRRYILCANHVFARLNEAALGEPIVQPSRVDGSAECAPLGATFRVARLADFEPLVFGNQGENRMDAAIAELDPGIDFVAATLADGYGAPRTRPIDAEPDMKVQKYGRTTGLTEARIKALDVTVKITFPSGKVRYVGQLMTSRGFGGFGDSGALVVTQDAADRPVGIVIGGSNNGSAIVTPIAPILERFGVKLLGR